MIINELEFFLVNYSFIYEKENDQRYLSSLIINIYIFYFLLLSLCDFSCLSLLSSLLRVHVYQYFHAIFLLVCFSFYLCCCYLLFCFGFVLELEMCFFCPILFFGIFRFTGFNKKKIVYLAHLLSKHNNFLNYFY